MRAINILAYSNFYLYRDLSIRDRFLYIYLIPPFYTLFIQGRSLKLHQFHFYPCFHLDLKLDVDPIPVPIPIPFFIQLMGIIFVGKDFSRDQFLQGLIFAGINFCRGWFLQGLIFADFDFAKINPRKILYLFKKSISLRYYF